MIGVGATREATIQKVKHPPLDTIDGDAEVMALPVFMDSFTDQRASDTTVCPCSQSTAGSHHAILHSPDR